MCVCVRGVTPLPSQWNDEGALFQTFSDQSPNIGYERLLFHWLNSPYQLCRVPLPETKVFFDSLMSVEEGPHFIACLLCSLSLKGPYFNDQRPLHLGTQIPTSLKKCPYFSHQSSHVSHVKTRLHRLGGGWHFRITIFYIKVPKFEIKNCKDCFTRL